MTKTVSLALSQALNRTMSLGLSLGLPYPPALALALPAQNSVPWCSPWCSLVLPGATPWCFPPPFPHWLCPAGGKQCRLLSLIPYFPLLLTLPYSSPCFLPRCFALLCPDGAGIDSVLCFAPPQFVQDLRAAGLRLCPGPEPVRMDPPTRLKGLSGPCRFGLRSTQCRPISHLGGRPFHCSARFVQFVPG